MRLLILPALLALAACATPEELPVTDADRAQILPGTPTLEDPAPDGFTPIRPATISVPGDGAWICTPAGAGMVSQCVRRGSTVESLGQPQTPVQPAVLNTAPTDSRTQSILDMVRNNDTIIEE